MPPALSIVIPTLNEADALPLLLGDLRPLAARLPVEVVVADGGSQDGTVARARELGARVVTTAPGRGGQLMAGVAASGGAVLWIVHADARVPPATIDAVELHVSEGRATPYAFRLEIASARWSLRAISRGANLRTRLLALPYGDQSLLITRALLERAGGFDDIPLMEDVALARRLRRIAPIRLLDAPVVVSPRRWLRDGPWRRSLRNLWILLRYLMGTPPARLAREYAPPPDTPRPP